MGDPYGIYKNQLNVRKAKIGNPNGSHISVDNAGNISFNGGAGIATALALGAFGDAVGIALSDSSLNALGIYPELAAAGDVLGAGLVAYGIRNRFLINKAQTNNVSLYATQGQLRVKAGLAAGVHSGLFGYFEQSGTVVLSSSGSFNSACNLAVETSAGLTLDSGVNLEGLTITGIIASATLNGNINGIHIRKAGVVSWPNGILIEGCTTGISFSGAVTTGIDFTGATLALDANRTNSAIAIGDRLGAKTITMAAAVNHLDPIQINLLLAGVDPTAGSTINGIYQKITTSASVDMPGVRLKCADWNVVVQKNIQDAFVYQGEIDFNAASIVAGGEVSVAGFVLNAGSSAVSCNSWRCLNVTLRGAGSPVDAHGIMVNAETGIVVADGIRLMGTGMRCAIRIGNFSYLESPVNFVGFPASGTQPVSNAGGTGHSGTVVKIACKVGSATYYMLASTTIT